MKKLEEYLKYEQPAKYIVESENYSDDYNIPVLTAGKSFILGYTNEERNIFPEKDLPVIIFDDFTTECKYVDFPFKVKSSAMKILHPIDNANPKFLYYYMKQIKFDNTLHKRYWISQYSQLEIPELDIKKQNEFAIKMEKIEKIIDIKKKEIKKIESLVKSQFVEMFRDCKKVKLHDIADITMGQSPSSSSYNDIGDGVPFFQGKADYGDKYTIVKHWTNQPKKLAYKNDVLMSVRAPVGPVNISSCDCCIGRGLCAITSKLGLTNNEFLYNALNTIQDDLSSKGTGSTFKAITKDDVYNLELPLASIELQNRFAAIVEQIDKQKFIGMKTLSNVSKIRYLC